MQHRTELEQLRAIGHELENPYEAVELFERTIAEFAGSKFAVATDCATHAIELSLRYLQVTETVRIPQHTYLSVPMTCLKLGIPIEWVDRKWEGIYVLDPTPVIDGSLRFRRGMYDSDAGHFHCLSFQFRKHLPIGRGGMILTSDEVAYQWLKKACHDGRTPGAFWKTDSVDMIGYHYYMTPEDAARGLLLFQELSQNAPDIGGWSNYPNIREFPVFSKS